MKKKLTNKKILFIVLIFLAIITLVRFSWNAYFTNPTHPEITEGILDLRGWDYLDEYSLNLNGEWEFYENTFLMEDGNNRDDNKMSYLNVPSNWATHPEIPSKGYGSYRLTVLLNEGVNDTFGIYVPKIYSSSELYINGELVNHSGTIGTSKNEYNPFYRPYTAYYPNDFKNEIEIIIQVANFDHPSKGGILYPLKFGAIEPLMSDMSTANNIIIISCAIYLFHAIYSFILFQIGNKDKRLLYFGFILIAVVIATLLGEHLFYTMLPISYAWSVKAYFLTALFGGFFLLHSLKNYIPEIARDKLVFIFNVLFALLLLVALFMPPSFTLHIKNMYLLFGLIPCFIAILAMIRATSRIDRENIYLLLAIVASVWSLMWLLTYTAFGIETFSYPVDLLIALVSFSTYLFKKHFKMYDYSLELTEKLKTADKEKNRFLIMVAHELRNPLHGILNLSRTVVEREKKSLSSKSVSELYLVEKVGRRLNLLINDLIDLQKLSDTKVKLNKKELNLYNITQSVIDMISYSIDTKQITLKNEIPKNFPFVIADENRLIQILFNLIHNAVKFTPIGEISVRASVEKNWAKIEVHDTGIGMNEDQLQKAFKPYEQIHYQNKLMDEGLGLGLAICKQLVELQGGKINVTSKVNHGSVFHFTLPLGNQNESFVFDPATPKSNEHLEIIKQTENHIAPKSKDNEPVINIIAVDDDHVNLQILESIFSESKYNLYTTTNPEEVLEQLQSNRWDLVITDVMMPTMSGFELTAEIRKRFPISKLPILLLTAYNREEDIEKGFQIGANDYVAKPIHLKELKARVDALTRLKRSVNDLLKMEAAWLQSQINPHFIINTFNAIASLSRIDLERMDRLIDQLTKFIRHSINFYNSDDLIPIELELQLVQAYLHILQERFLDKIAVNWEVDDELDVMIPPLSIQPLVENAVEHGILNDFDGGVITISIKDNGNYIDVSVTDTGEGIPPNELEHLFDKKSGNTSIGLMNTNHRLNRFFGSGLTVTSKLEQGTTVSFSIPKIKK